MKELSIEEKAKAYDELKVKAQELTEDGYIDKLALLDLFPELKNEDERIREKICKLLWDNAPYEEAQEYIAWLEKQGTSYTKRDVDDAYVEGMAFAKYELEKQGKQMPAWSEEDENRITDIVYFLNTAKKHYASTIELDSCIDWLKSLRPQNHWKPNDEQMEVLQWCTPLWSEPKTKAVLESLIADLKKLKE